MRETLLTTRIFDVERVTLEPANGERTTREIVVHPGAVVIIPRLDGDRFVMVRNYRITVDMELLELPAGTMEQDESPIETANRELEEETGYVAKTMTPFIEFYSSPGICTELMRVFIADGLTQTEQRLDAGEQIRVELMGKPGLRDALNDGTIRDGKTIAALGAYFLKGEMRS